ncbi:hypothetical protein NIES1031_04820 [Chroogloeocystis siderophila 5.2 s.c.1]|jgi:hypothetical protein|uniref:Uncharacterized protein n=1 Tax=Chroogloeocystis siderophila 5.2 s.c.1 TaxID=247279 RepID=A0A1U7HY35_9CHRO|nr:hypothetical protein NIES1031_04820 [Chroogloeocystis siderophila 5.2 s.c.1]
MILVNILEEYRNRLQTHGSEKRREFNVLRAISYSASQLGYDQENYALNNKANTYVFANILKK